MKRESISKVIGNINEKHISEAENYTSTVKRYSIKSFFIKAPVAACLILCLLVGTVAYAAYEAYEWSTSILFEDGSKVQLVENATFKEIPDSAPKTERTEDSIGTIKMTHAEVEKVLGFKILGYDKATSDEMGYKTMQNKDGTIGRIDLWWADFLEISEEKQMTLHISMLNKGADEGFVLAFEEGQDAAGGKKMLQSSYPIRLLLLAVILFACAKSGVFNVIALVLPLLFVRLSLTIAEFFRKKGV